MKTQTLRLIGLAGGLAMLALIVLGGCGVRHNPAVPPWDNGGGRTAEVVLTVAWKKTRVIPPQTQKIDVTISGDGLADPIRDTIQRPPNDQSVTKVYQLPVGFKRITAAAKDANDQLLASGDAQAILLEGQRSNAEVVMAEVARKTVTVRTLRGRQPVAPLWIAYQDGDGQWQVPPGTGGEYTLTIDDPRGRYGVVIVHTEGEQFHSFVTVDILHATVDELPNIDYLITGEEPGNRVRLSGNVTGWNGASYARVAMRNSQSDVWSYYGNEYSLTVPPGTHDLLAARFPFASGGADKMVIRRGVPVTTDVSHDIDFGATDAFDLVRGSGTVQGDLGGILQMFMTFLSDGGTEMMIHLQYEMVGPSFAFKAVPTDKMVGNDMHRLMLSEYGGDDLRNVIVYSKTPDNLTINFPPPFGEATVTTYATTPYLRLTGSWEAYTGAQAYILSYNSEIPSGPARSRQYAGVSWGVYLSNGWLGAQSSYTLPDLSEVSGWNGTWGLTSGYLRWTVGAITSNSSLSDLLRTEISPIDGLEIRNALKQGSPSRQRMAKPR